MPSKAKKLLARARRSPSGWRRSELDALYKGFGFIIEARAKHDMAFHEKYPMLLSTLPRHTKVNRVYVEQAVKLINRLLELEGKEADLE